MCIWYVCKYIPHILLIIIYQKWFNQAAWYWQVGAPWRHRGNKSLPFWNWRVVPGGRHRWFSGFAAPNGRRLKPEMPGKLGNSQEKWRLEWKHHRYMAEHFDCHLWCFAWQTPFHEPINHLGMMLTPCYPFWWHNSEDLRIVIHRLGGSRWRSY